MFSFTGHDINNSFFRAQSLGLLHAVILNVVWSQESTFGWRVARVISRPHDQWDRQSNQGDTAPNQTPLWIPLKPLNSTMIFEIDTETHIRGGDIKPKFK